MAQTRRSFLNSIPLFLLAWMPGRTGAKPATETSKLAQAMEAETGGHRPVESGQVSLTVPDIAEDGALVPVTIESSLPVAESLWIFVEKNPTPLAAHCKFEASLEPFVSLRIKMNESCDVVAVVKAGEQYFSARKAVRVMLGGCG